MKKMGIVLGLSMLLVVIARCEAYNEYDYFQVVMQWQPASCSDTRQRTPCLKPPEDRFSIHGVWPSLNSGRMPYCSGSPFDMSKLIHVESGLKTNWPNVISGDDKWLWTHEWEKHGTCLEPYLNQLQYFTFGLNAYALHDMVHSLSSYNILPNGRTYTKLQVQTAVARATGKKPGLRCNTNYYTGKKQLHEVSVCYTKNASALLDCPTDADTCFDTFVWNA